LYGLGLRIDGSIDAWGYSGYGGLDVPAPNADFVAISANMIHALGLKSDGSIVAWGYGATPAPPPNVSFASIAAGDYANCDDEGNCEFYSYSLGVKSDGTIIAWGNNILGKLDVTTPNSGRVAIADWARQGLG